MKRVFSYFLLIGSSLFLLYSCTKSTSSSSDLVGNWVTISDFDGVARSEAVSFVIGDTAYISTGYDGTVRLNDTWKYDADKNFWLQRATFPGAARSSAVAFNTTTKAYVTTGFDGLNKLKDTYEYNPVTNVWTKKADFGGSARVDAVAFGIADLGYVTTGNDGNDLKDFWQYNPATDSWVQKVSLGGSKRSAAVSFVYKNIGYVVTGINNGQTVNDFWAYDPSGDKWTEKRFITNYSTDTYDDNYNIVRNNAASFVMTDRSGKDHAYVCTGENGGILKTVWEYDFDADVWTRKTDWEGTERTGAIGFSVKKRGFLGTGRNSTYRFDNFKEFLPSDTYNSND
ncbi:MAG: kelch repeat-containing protein [Chitinophagaceae bacterium]